MRVFYAVQFPDAVKQAMADNLLEIKKYAVRGSFTPRDNFHATLLFVGECDPRGLAGYKQAADSAIARLKPAPVKAEISGLGAFTRPDGDILWAGMRTEPENILAKINKGVFAELRALGINIKQDFRSFVPHVTIARGFAGDLSRVDFAPVNFEISSIVLMHSIFSGGVRYEPVHESGF